MFKAAFKGLKSLTAAGLFLAPVPSALYCQNHAQSHSHHHDHHSCHPKDLDPDYKRLIDGNKFYVDQKMAQDPDYFKKLAQGPRPKYLFIGCSDSRVPPNELTNTGPGELFIHRNVANLVAPTDFNLNSVLQFSIEVLKVRHIIIMGHTQCGGVKASIDGTYHGMIDQWLVAIREVYHKYNKELDPIQDSEEKLKKLTEFTVKEQVMNLCKNQFVQKAWAANQPLDIHGWICDIETGRIIDLQANEKHWNEIKPHFTMHYNKEQLVRS